MPLAPAIMSDDPGLGVRVHLQWRGIVVDGAALVPLALIGVVADVAALRAVGGVARWSSVVNLAVRWPLLLITLLYRLMRVAGLRVLRRRRGLSALSPALHVGRCTAHAAVAPLWPERRVASGLAPTRYRCSATSIYRNRNPHVADSTTYYPAATHTSAQSPLFCLRCSPLTAGRDVHG